MLKSTEAELNELVGDMLFYEKIDCGVADGFVDESYVAEVFSSVKFSDRLGHLIWQFVEDKHILL